MAHQYKQISIGEREAIQTGLWEGKSLRKIAREIGRSASTVFRELKRNGSEERRHYIPRLAHERTRKRTADRGKRSRLKNPLIRNYVEDKLRDGYSPEQIAGRLKTDMPSQRISHEAIYQYIYAQYRRGGYGTCFGSDLRQYLRRRHKVRYPKKIPYAVERGSVKNRISIDYRPEEVTLRQAPGHWEGDSVESLKHIPGINTLVERVSGLVLISKLNSRKSEATAKVIVRRLMRIPRVLRRTLTLDNGSENAKHERIADLTGMNIFFAHPYHSWERGTNENTNGLIRWYLPRGTDFSAVSEKTLQEVEYRLNTRPRKRLGWRTPEEVFNSFLLQ